MSDDRYILMTCQVAILIFCVATPSLSNSAAWDVSCAGAISTLQMTQMEVESAHSELESAKSEMEDKVSRYKRCVRYSEDDCERYRRLANEAIEAYNDALGVLKSKISSFELHTASFNGLCLR